MVTGNSEEEGSKKTKLFKGKYESKLKFLEWWGVHPPPKKNPCLTGGGGGGYFLEPHNVD